MSFDLAGLKRQIAGAEPPPTVPEFVAKCPECGVDLKIVLGRHSKIHMISHGPSPRCSHSLNTVASGEDRTAVKVEIQQWLRAERLRRAKLKLVTPA